MNLKELKKYLTYNSFRPTRFYVRRDGGFALTSCNEDHEYEECNCNLSLRYKEYLKDNSKGYPQCHCEQLDMSCDSFFVIRGKFRIIADNDEWDGCNGYEADIWAGRNELKVSL